MAVSSLEMAQHYLDELLLPSPLRPAGSRHDSIKRRLDRARGCTQGCGFEVSEEEQKNEHFWYRVVEDYTLTFGALARYIPDRAQRRIASLELSLQHARGTLETEKAAALDPLTRAWSRGALDNFLRNILSTAKTRPSIAGVLMLDVDNFKQYNDSKGHLAGDAALIGMVRVLERSVHQTDMVGRYGGEEFTVILPTLISPRLASVRAEQLRKAVAGEVGITVSIGVTALRADDLDIATIYKRADDNLYKAKYHLGKNVVCNDRGKVAFRQRT